jgi:diguanylate cyclase (GGDEF)-like protein
MTMGVANGHAHARREAAHGMRGPRDAAHEIVDPVPAAAFARSALARASTTELHRALSISQQQVVTAQRQIDALQKRDELLKQEVNQLAQAVAQARRFAHYDQLTRLPNRTLLLDRFGQAIARAARQHKQVALLFLDLDGFKSINDVLGHTGGDRLLQQVAARLTASIRTSDTACRYGGDEFVILLPDLERRESAVAAKEKIWAHLAAPYLVGGTSIQVTASIGVAVYPTDGKEFDDLIQQSDARMYCNKACGPAPARIFVVRP